MACGEQLADGLRANVAGATGNGYAHVEPEMDGAVRRDQSNLSRGDSIEHPFYQHDGGMDAPALGLKPPEPVTAPNIMRRWRPWTEPRASAPRINAWTHSIGSETESMCRARRSS